MKRDLKLTAVSPSETQASSVKVFHGLSTD